VRPLPRAVLGKNINRLRTQAGLTQDDVAALAEIDRRYVQRIEAGTANPGIDVICRIRTALGASWDEVVRGLGKAGGD
jgi:transcriptional regulator with XRE-family HTH domain